MITTLETRLDAAATWIASGRWWAARAALLALAVSLLGSTPDVRVPFRAADAPTNIEFSWATLASKIRNPLYDPSREHGQNTHEAKLTFRLTVPVIARLLGLGRGGVLALYWAAGLGLLYAAALLAGRESGDPVTGLYAAVLVASTWPGVTAFQFFLSYSIFDAVALFFLLLAMLSRGPASVGVCVFLAAWTDERGLIASPLVLAFHAFRDVGPRDVRVQGLFRGPATGVLLAWASYGVTRVSLSLAFGMRTATSGADLTTFLKNLNLLPFGAWTALEGGWIIVAAAELALIAGRRPVAATIFAAGVALVVVTGASVYDVSRGMAYLLPALFVGLRVLVSLAPSFPLRRLMLVAAGLSVLCPTYYAHTIDHVTWMLPLPLRALKWLRGSET